MTLISVYTSEGCIGRCDAKCYAEVMVEKYAAQHQLTDYRGELGEAVVQLPLF